MGALDQSVVPFVFPYGAGRRLQILHERGPCDAAPCAHTSPEHRDESRPLVDGSEAVSGGCARGHQQLLRKEGNATIPGAGGCRSVPQGYTKPSAITVRS
jgi:hypothetical protein